MSKICFIFIRKFILISIHNIVIFLFDIDNIIFVFSLNLTYNIYSCNNIKKVR